jgi:signal transduction histidine kinase/ActR/RegA family two-component response regulator
MLVRLNKIKISDSKSSQLEQLTRRVWIATGVPISLVIVFLLSFLIYLEFKKGLERESAAIAFLTREFNSQSGLITNEFYLGQEKGLKLRLDSFSKSATERFPEFDFCFAVIPLDQKQVLGMAPKCYGNGFRGKTHLVSLLEIQIGKINYGVKRAMAHARYISSDVLWAAIVSFLSGLGIQYFIVTLLRKSLVVPFVENTSLLAEQRAIARTTQSLAHDIRRPFSMLKMAFDAFESAITPEEAQENVREVLPEVDRAMASVEGMLQDIIHIRGGDSKANQEEAFVESIVSTVMGDVFRIFPDADFNVDYCFGHKSSIFVDTIRVSRVLTNILVNAVQAIKGKGEIWIKTLDKGDFIEFRLGNAGSWIPKEHLNKLFDAFYTHGKTGGTGLGLAIAQKVVTEHGGQIRCESDKSNLYPNGYVEFIFTLPIGIQMLPLVSEPLFPSCKKFKEHAEKLRLVLRASGTVLEQAEEKEIEQKVKEKLKCINGRLPPILIVEDEAAYRNMLESLLQRYDSLISEIPILFAKNSVEAISLGQEFNPFLVIEDVDLGPDSECGLDIIKNLRSIGFKGRICVHSNRFLFEEQKTALNAGADLVLPKPMSRGHLLHLLLSAIPEKDSIHLVKQMPERPLKIVYLDDTKTFTFMWKVRLKNQLEIETYNSTKPFLAKCESEVKYLGSIDAIVTDYQFAECDEHTGKTLAEELRKRGYRGPIMLATNEAFEKAALLPHLTGAIGKEVPCLGTIRSWIRD